MNRYDYLIHEFLQQHKSVSLDKMGTFSTTGEPFVTENNTVTAQSKIDFIFDKKAETTPELIAFIASTLNKNKNLVASDLDSYLLETRQWINISKAYTLEGMGEIVMDKSGVLQFRQMAPLSAKEEENRRRQPRVKDTYTPAAHVKGRKKGGVFVFAIFILLVIIGGAGWFAYNYLVNGKKQTTAVPAAPVVTPGADSSRSEVAQPAVKDTPGITASQPVKSGEQHYKYIFEVTLNRDRAVSRTAKLNSYGNKASFDSVTGGAFVRYRMYLDVVAAPADTLRIKDSLTRYLQKSILITQ